MTCTAFVYLVKQNINNNIIINYVILYNIYIYDIKSDAKYNNNNII